MPDPFDPYREALVVEERTHWPRSLGDQRADLSAASVAAVEAALHADAAAAGCLDYVRVHTGFCRQITVTAEDLERLSPAPEG